LFTDQKFKIGFIGIHQRLLGSFLAGIATHHCRQRLIGRIGGSGKAHGNRPLAAVGLPAAGQIEGSTERLVRYSPDLEMSWVWAFSFARGRPALVPEQIAYYGRITPPRERFVIETSNGCALGGTLEEVRPSFWA